MFIRCCKRRFFSVCADLRNDVSNYSASAAMYFMAHRTFAPLGHDPTFETTSRLWNYDLIGKEGEYYNTSQANTVTISLTS